VQVSIGIGTVNGAKPMVVRIDRGEPRMERNLLLFALIEANQGITINEFSVTQEQSVLLQFSLERLKDGTRLLVVELA
jgi:hypothetical protein